MSSVAGTILIIGIVLALAFATWISFNHNYSETISTCEKHNLVLSHTGVYSLARCTDPRTGIVYDPQFLDGAQPENR